MSDQDEHVKRIVERMVRENPDIPAHQLVAMGQDIGRLMVECNLSAEQACDHIVGLVRAADPKLHVRKSTQQAELDRHVQQLHKDREEMKKRGGGQ